MLTCNLHSGGGLSYLLPSYLLTGGSRLLNINLMTLLVLLVNLLVVVVLLVHLLLTSMLVLVVDFLTYLPYLLTGSNGLPST